VPRHAVLCGCPHPRRAAGAGCYRGVPGHPSKHEAIIKPGRSRPLRDASPLRRTSGSSCEKRVPPQPARAEDTMRNHRCLGDKRQRGKEAELSPPGAGSAATTRPSGQRDAEPSPVQRPSTVPWSATCSTSATGTTARGSSSAHQEIRRARCTGWARCPGSFSRPATSYPTGGPSPKALWSCLAWWRCSGSPSWTAGMAPAGTRYSRATGADSLCGRQRSM
jgi:hypothetical protein